VFSGLWYLISIWIGKEFAGVRKGKQARMGREKRYCAVNNTRGTGHVNSTGE